MNIRVAGGSVAGVVHARAGRACQDGFAWTRARMHDAGDALVAVVCDGCGSAPRSEIGAGIGARIFAARAAEALREDRSGDPEATARIAAALAAEALLERLDALAVAMSGPPDEDPAPGAVTPYARTVHDAFLFTVVCAIVTPRVTMVFAAGDGVVVADGERVVLGPFDDDAPPYLAYALLDPSRPRAPALVLRRETAAGSALAIGTDGASEIVTWPELDAIRDRRLVDHPDAIRRRLVVARRGDRSSALSDDATVVLLRVDDEVPS